MSIGIGLPFAPEHGQRMVGKIRQEPMQGQTRGSERRGRADREARQA